MIPRSVMDFGDVAFLIKYRLLSANEEHGNYIVTAFLGWSVPTGQYKNGASHAVITPTIAYGKGFGNFDLQGTFGVGFPIGGGYQIASTHFHTSNHNAIWTIRFPF